MASPQTILPWLLGLAIGAGGIIQGLHWRASRAPADLETIESQLRVASEENEILRRENESLRSIAQGGGSLSVPADLIARVEKELGLTFRTPPVVQRQRKEELRDRAAASWEIHYGPSAIADREEAWRWMGIIADDDPLLFDLSAGDAVGINGWFDRTSGESWMLDRSRVDHIPDQGALIRLLTLALLYQHYPPPTEYPGDDAARARDALFYGIAAASEARFLSEKARTDGFLAMNPNHEREQVLETLPSFIQGLTQFPWIEGKSYATFHWVKSLEELRSRLATPPLTTYQIFFPAEEMPIAPDFGPQATSKKDVIFSDSLGMLGLRLWLDRLGDSATAIELSEKWQGDRYQFFADGEASSAVLWDVELLDSESAAQLESHMLQLVAALAGQEEIATLNQPIVTKDDRHMGVTRLTEKRLRLINSASAVTFSELTPSP
ncbi:MAG: hypothetical protein EAZ42_06665 [Verrucomicrobia bacterium]|nr:MAG: hypothetical protein EAZ42_06665 [Verrucomicrobiota bacterium]